MRRRHKAKPMEKEYPEPEVAEGELIEVKPNALFAVRLDDGRVLSSCYLRRVCMLGMSAKTMAQMVPKVGDRVQVEVSPYNADRGRIFLTRRKPATRRKSSDD